LHAAAGFEPMVIAAHDFFSARGLSMQVQTVAAAALLALFLSACGEDAAATVTGDAEATGTDDASQIGTADPAMTFLPIGGTATTGAVAITGSAVDAQHVHVEVAIQNFADLFGISGHFHYDPAVLQLTALQANAVPLGYKKSTADYKPRAVAVESPTGRILLGGARFSNIPTPFDTPSGVKVDREVWLVLDFTVLQKVKQTTLAFDPNSLVVRDGPYTDVPTDWGQLQINWVQK
jgi:hypothetical protein